jgi:hypothetical protein
MQEKKVKLQVIAKGLPVHAKSETLPGVTALGCGGAGACLAVPLDVN